MLYVKVDANGNPIEVAKNYSEIKKEYAARNTAIPNEMIFSSIIEEMGYAGVDYSEPIPSKAGMKIVPDIPKKEEDGTMKRTWKYEPVTDEEIAEVSVLMRERRRTLLRNHIDNISPVRWEKFTTEEKTEISNWHQSLLDIPEKEGWPFVSFDPVPASLK